MFEWITGNSYANIVTLNQNNFTLNSVSSQYFENVRWCEIGIDALNHKVAIRPITAREKDLDIIAKERLTKVSVGKGYARISNKSAIDKISDIIKKECNGLKFLATFDEKEKMLIIDLDQPQ